MNQNNIFFEIHKDIPREGPGNNQSTRKAFRLLSDLSLDPEVLDIGCGPGMQTIELASLTEGNITAVDTHEPFLIELEKRSIEAGTKEKITPIRASMFSLPFKPKQYDLIWSEGAIYIIGFERGLIEWRSLLKESGYLVVSELSWLKNDRPEEVEDFWLENYPGMKPIEENFQIIKSSGYRSIDSFILDESGWWKDYYLPMEQRISQLRQKYIGDQGIQQQLDMEQREIDLYKKYSAYYGYVFYIMQKGR